MYHLVFVIHLLAATIWTGGHLVLALGVLPVVMKERSVARLRQFEERFERIGMPALLVQVASGLWLAHTVVPDMGRWIAPSDPLARTVQIKLLLLVLTVLLAADTRARIIPKLDQRLLPTMAWRIVMVTLLSVGFVVAGASFRFGGLF